ncbi:MAG: sensor histidine kinase [Chloroflexi bacterium]|nr:sensor histidine kinase [Chloroflexota bacterium]
MLVLAALAPFIVLEVYRSAQDIEERRNEIEQRARAQAAEEAATMDDFLRFTERFLATLAASPSVQSMDGPGSEALFQAARAQFTNYENIFLLTRSGEQIASTVPIYSDPEARERGWFQEALTTDDAAISPVLASQGSGSSVVVLARAVTTPGGARIGVLAVALNVARLSSVIGFVGLPDGSAVLLVQADGTVIASGHDPDTWVGRQLGGDFLPELRTGAGLVVAEMQDGVTRVAGYQPVGRAPWIMVAAIPLAEVDTAVRQSLLRIAEQVAIAAVGAAVLTWIVLRRVVLPIRVLSDGARGFAAGFLNRRIPLHRRDELGELAAALNSMAADLERRLDDEAAHAEALRRLNQLQTEFVATASHELRTPVTAIHTYAEALLRPDITDEQTRRECLEGITRGSARLTRLVRALLDVSRIDSGRVAVDLAPVDVVAVVRSAIAQAAAEAGATIHLEIAAGLPLALADSDRLEDVVANLISNARKFSPAEATVTVSVMREGDAISIAVADNGGGIAAEEMDRIFDRFYQIERGAARGAGGAGLGLYIVRGYVTAMGGRITVASTPDIGSTFRIILPIAASPDTRPDEEGDDAAIAGTAARG